MHLQALQQISTTPVIRYSTYWKRPRMGAYTSFIRLNSLPCSMYNGIIPRRIHMPELQSLRCPACGAPLDVKIADGRTMTCPYCKAAVVIPKELQQENEIPS